MLCAALPTREIRSEGLDPALQSKIDSQIKQVQAWAAAPVIVEAVKAHNTSPPSDAAAMTQEKWQTLSILDPFVRGRSKNPVAMFLKANKGDLVSEAFVSGADGAKVGFLSKPSNWSHKAKPKHEVPMSGKSWQGGIEVDDSTGLSQIQVAVPVMDGTKPIGSMTVGLKLSKLGND
jgi:hypothetical protein